MKDLKHLKYFEDLLQDANNELIEQARGEGKKCAAYACENTPEPLLNLDGVFSVRLRAPRTSSMEMATYYLTSFLCEYSRALLERSDTPLRAAGGATSAAFPSERCFFS